MIIFAICKSKLGNIVNLDVLRTYAENQIESLSYIGNHEYLRDTHYLVPWFFIYHVGTPPEEITKNFIDKIKTFIKNDPKCSFNDTSFGQLDISIVNKVIETYLNPVYGKIPERSPYTMVAVIDENNEASIDTTVAEWYSFFNEWNRDLGNLFTLPDYSFLVKGILKQLSFRKKNKANYTICYSNIKEVSREISHKINAKISGFEKVSKELATRLIRDEQLLEDQKVMVKDLIRSLGLAVWLNKDEPYDKAKLRNTFFYEKFLQEKREDINQIQQKWQEGIDKRQKGREKAGMPSGIVEEFTEDILNEKERGLYINYLSVRFNNTEYFKFFKNKNDCNKVNLINIKNFLDLMLKYLGLKEDNNKNNITEYLIYGAIIINDLRKVKGNSSPENSYVLIDQEVTVVLREKENQIGRAGFNSRRYSLEGNDASCNLIRKRNAHNHTKGVPLGNGISGHMAGLLNEFGAKYKVQIACSMFFFWQLCYEKRATATHSMIETFEAIADSKNAPSTDTAPLQNNWYEEIKRKSHEKKFFPVEFLEKCLVCCSDTAV